MAYQRPFLICLKRNSTHEQWGFRTFGGKEYGQPHIVEKVTPDSTAERAGIREGDEIIQIGRVNIQDTTFNQVQELLAKSGNKIEMFVVREDLLTSRKGKEPSHVRAVVHNPYNSPLHLYSTENIAETLAKQAEALTEGHVSSIDEEDAPENLSFKQKSAVFQLLEEQAKQENDNHTQYYSRPRKAPPPKAPPLDVQHYQNKENYNPRHDYNNVQQQAHSTCLQKGDVYQNQLSEEYWREAQNIMKFTASPQNFSIATISDKATDQNQTSEYRSGLGNSFPGKQAQQPRHNTVSTVFDQQKQQQQKSQPYSIYDDKNYRFTQEKQVQQQKQSDQHIAQKQHRYYQEQEQQQQGPFKSQMDFQEQDAINSAQHSSRRDSPFKASPSQRNRMNWLPSAPQQNGQWSSPSTTPSYPQKNLGEVAWPPKQHTVKELPKTGFNPGVLKEQGVGRRCIWPPPKPEDELRSGRTTPQSPVTGRRIAWNPSPSPPLVRRSPFGSASPVTRRKDIHWPPAQQVAHKVENVQHKPSPTLARKANFDDFIKQHASTNVPSTYKPPPGMHRVA